MLARTTARWTLGLVIGLIAVGLLAASAMAQTPTSTATATATPTKTATAAATSTGTAGATATPAPASTGNAGLFASNSSSVLGIALLAVVAGGVVIGGRELAKRRE